MKAMRLALHLVLEGGGDAEDVVDSPASILSVVPEQEEDEEDVEIDSPGSNSAAEGVVCTQHVRSSRASCAKRVVLWRHNRSVACPWLASSLS